MKSLMDRRRRRARLPARRIAAILQIAAPACSRLRISATHRLLVLGCSEPAATNASRALVPPISTTIARCQTWFVPNGCRDGGETPSGQRFTASATAFGSNAEEFEQFTRRRDSPKRSSRRPRLRARRICAVIGHTGLYRNTLDAIRQHRFAITCVLPVEYVRARHRHHLTAMPAPASSFCAATASETSERCDDDRFRASDIEQHITARAICLMRIESRI